MKDLIESCTTDMDAKVLLTQERRKKLVLGENIIDGKYDRASRNKVNRDRVKKNAKNSTGVNGTKKNTVDDEEETDWGEMDKTEVKKMDKNTKGTESPLTMEDGKSDENETGESGKEDTGSHSTQQGANQNNNVKTEIDSRHPAVVTGCKVKIEDAVDFMSSGPKKTKPNKRGVKTESEAKESCKHGRPKRGRQNEVKKEGSMEDTKDSDVQMISAQTRNGKRNKVMAISNDQGTLQDVGEDTLDTSPIKKRKGRQKNGKAGTNKANSEERPETTKKRRLTRQTIVKSDTQDDVKVTVQTLGRKKRGQNEANAKSTPRKYHTQASKDSPNNAVQTSDRKKGTLVETTEEDGAVQTARKWKGNKKDVQEQRTCKWEENFIKYKWADSAKKKYVGGHVSIAGGVYKAVLEAEEMGARAFGLFLRSQRQWASKPLADVDAQKFRDTCKVHGYHADMIIPHGSYLMNCGSPDSENLRKSRDLLVEELQRCEKLGLTKFNFHPGSTCGKISVEECLDRIGESINQALVKTKGVTAVIENMCCQGNTVGGKFEELKGIINRVHDKTRVGICLDTCHMFAAGYNISTEKGYQDMMEGFDRIVGLKYLKAIHLNDSKGEVGNHLDRHENIGKGRIGIDGFRRIMNDPRLNSIPMILETPCPNDDIYEREVRILYTMCK